MSLITGYDTMAMCPFCPCLCEVLEDKFTKCFAVVRHNLYITVNELLNVILKAITSAFLELRKEVGGVVSLANLIGIIEEGMRIWRVRFLESIADML